MGSIKQLFGLLELYKWFATKTEMSVGNQILWSDLRFVCVLQNYIVPEGLAKEFPQHVESPKCLDLIDCTTVSPFSHTNLSKKRPRCI